MTKKKVAYISYIEDTKKHHDLIAQAALKGTQRAVRRSKKASISITYIDGLEIVKESPRGRRRVIDTIGARRRVKVGTKEKIS